MGAKEFKKLSIWGKEFDDLHRSQASNISCITKEYKRQINTLEIVCRRAQCHGRLYPWQTESSSGCSFPPKFKRARR